ncbi:MAG TPA: polyprenyl synthetase family protein [Planctomycetaceae bacterium]|nr:polyprenyl synthetase family protein [Planctomycetaceae bacterium]
MNPETRAQVPESLRPVYSLIEPELTALEETMRRELGETDPFVSEVVRYAFKLGGKRLRPVLLFLCAKNAAPAEDTVAAAHYLLAAAIEMIHTATLIHDDILDGATIRRHLATMNVRWDGETSVLAGDLLFMLAMQMITRLDDLEGYRITAEALKKTCLGELRQVGARNRFDLTEGEYLDIIGDKTAALLGCSCRLGAYFAKATHEMSLRYERYGYNLGLAFQIADDILDLTGDEEQMGKTLGTDLVNRKATLPLIHYLHTSNPAERKEMLELVTDEDLANGDGETIIAMVIDRLTKHGSIDAARCKAETFIDDAIGLLPDEVAYRETHAALVELARFVVRRKS